MESMKRSPYRDYEIETVSVKVNQGYAALFVIHNPRSPALERQMRECTGSHATSEEAHRHAWHDARKLIDMLLDDAIGGPWRF